MKIEITAQQLEKLFNTGLIHPSDIRCLDAESKQQLKTLCLQMCHPKNCIRCDAQRHCLNKAGVTPVNLELLTRSGHSYS